MEHGQDSACDSDKRFEIASEDVVIPNPDGIVSPVWQKRIGADGQLEFELELSELMHMVARNLFGKQGLGGRHMQAVFPNRQAVEEFCTGLVLGCDSSGDLAIVSIDSNCCQFICWVNQSILDRLGGEVVGCKILA